jgi:transcriptional regulator with XRE-family HTH domain
MNENTAIHTDQQNSARAVGAFIRNTRKHHGWTISQFAAKLSRQREWLNRIELGYSEFGEYKPATRAELEAMLDLFEGLTKEKHEWVLAMGDLAMADYYELKLQTDKVKRTSFGKLTQTEIVIGEKQIVAAIADLIRQQDADGIIRNTGVKNLGSYKQVNDNWQEYRTALGAYLSQNPNAMFKRIEYTTTLEQLGHAQEADRKLAGDRPLKKVHNAKIKFSSQNPLSLHAVIGQNEAILALPQTTGQAGSNIALLIRDKVFVEALRIWYDEVMWDMPGASVQVDYEHFDESFESIKDMYKFTD